MKPTNELLRDIRNDHDLTQKDVAKILGISQQHYSQYENGNYELPLRHLARLADYYHVSADYLLGRCALHAKEDLDLVHITADCTAAAFLERLLSLSPESRKSTVEYLDLQKLKQDLQLKKNQP